MLSILRLFLILVIRSLLLFLFLLYKYYSRYRKIKDKVNKTWIITAHGLEMIQSVFHNDGLSELTTSYLPAFSPFGKIWPLFTFHGFAPSPVVCHFNKRMLILRFPKYKPS